MQNIHLLLHHGPKARAEGVHHIQARYNDNLHKFATGSTTQTTCLTINTVVKTIFADKGKLSDLT
jgi:hypothetical protein